MKIAVIVDGLGLGGAEKQAIITVAELRKLGLHSELIVYNSINEYTELLTQCNVEPVFLLSKGFLKYKRLIQITRFLKKNKFDVLYCLKGTSSVYGRVAAKIAGIPSIYAGYRGQHGSTPLFRIINHILTYRTNGWIVNACSVKEAVVKNFCVKADCVYVVPNAVDINSCNSSLTYDQARNKFGINENDLAVISIANLVKIKNHRMLVKAAQEVVKYNPNVKFFLAGKGPQETNITDMIRSYKLSHNIILLGFCEDIPDLLKAADIAILTSWQEGLPNAILESQMAGVPCVSTDCGDIKKIIQDGQTGYIVPVNDHTAMADKLKILINDDNLRRSMGKEAQKYIFHHYSPETMAKKLLSIFKESLK